MPQHQVQVVCPGTTHQSWVLGQRFQNRLRFPCNAFNPGLSPQKVPPSSNSLNYTETFKNTSTSAFPILFSPTISKNKHSVKNLLSMHQSPFGGTCTGIILFPVTEAIRIQLFPHSPKETTKCQALPLIFPVSRDTFIFTSWSQVHSVTGCFSLMETEFSTLLLLWFMCVLHSIVRQHLWINISRIFWIS